MRPLFICRQFLPIAHGAESQAAALAREINAMGHPAKVLAGRQDLSWPERETIEGVDVVRLQSPQQRFLGTWRYLHALRDYLFEERDSYDVIHVMFAKHSAALAGRMSSRLNKPVVCKPACAGSYGDLKALWKTAFPRRTLAGIFKIDRLIAISDEIATEWISAGFPVERIARLSNGVDIDRFKPAAHGEKEDARRRLGLPPSVKLIVGAGRLERQKGFEVLLEAVGRLDEDANVHVAIAGEGSRRADLLRLAESIGLGDRIHLLGRINAVEDVYHAADLFVLSSRGEGMSNALLEAMACGLDAVAALVSGVSELIRDGESGLIVAPESSQSMAEALRIWLTTDPGRFGRVARATVEQHYSLHSVAERTLALYQEVIEERAKAAMNQGRV